MTREQSINIVKEACVKANPEILELKQNCFVKDFLKGTLEILAKYEIEGETPVYDFVFRGEGEVSVARSPRGNWDILGRPIRLADVLLAIQKKDTLENPININTYGHLELCGEEQIVLSRTTWNLRADSLTDQSDQTLLFLAQLLEKKD